jgi:hypothetical protein
MAQPPLSGQQGPSPWAVQLLKISVGVAVGALLLLASSCILT